MAAACARIGSGVPELTFSLEATPPFRLDLTVWALRRRAHNLVDRFDDAIWRRVLILDSASVGIAVEQVRSGDHPQVEVTLTARAPNEVKKQAAGTIVRMLGLEHDLSGFYRVASKDKILGPLVERLRGMKPVRFPTFFEAFANAIACQLVSLSAGMHVLNRIAKAYGETRRVGGMTMNSFATARNIARADRESLRVLGLSRQKADYLIDLARLAIDPSNRDFEYLTTFDDAAAIARLQEIRGVGRWTAEYVLLRGAGRINIFPGDDVGGRNALFNWLGATDEPNYDSVRRLLSRWHPYAGLVYLHLLVDHLLAYGVVAGHSKVRRGIAKI